MNIYMNDDDVAKFLQLFPLWSCEAALKHGVITHDGEASINYPQDLPKGLKLRRLDLLVCIGLLRIEMSLFSPLS